MSSVPDVRSMHRARYFDGLSAESRETSAWVDASGVWVAREGGEPRCWPFAELVLVRGGGHEPVQLERRSMPVEVIVVDEPAFFRELRAAMPRGQKLAGQTAVPMARMLLMLLLGAALALVLLWRFGIPALADRAADQVPLDWERAHGRESVAQMVPEAARVQDPAIRGPVLAAYLKLARTAAIDDAPEYLIVWREKMPNAFAAPGGTVVVTTGLLAILQQPDELAAVIAHEIGHVQHRHVVRGALRRAGLGLLVALVAGDASVLSTGLQVAGELGGLSYSREYERQADDAAIQLLAANGTGADALVRALERLKTASGTAGKLPGFLSTHPAPDDRMQRLREPHGVVPVGQPDWIGATEWSAMKAAVR